MKGLYIKLMVMNVVGLLSSIVLITLGLPIPGAVCAVVNSLLALYWLALLRKGR